MMNQPRLSPPWYTLWNEINSSIGNDSHVKVGQLDESSSPYTIMITVDQHEKAAALASIMTLHFEMGNITVDVHVKDKKGVIIQPIIPDSADKLSKLVHTALSDNGWFKNVVARPLSPGAKESVFPVFSKSVIQFFNDDQSDLYHNYNNVAAFVFMSVLNPSPGGYWLIPSTEKMQ